MSEHDPDSWIASVRRLANSMLGLARTRVKLFSLELQEEKLRTINLAVLLCLALALGATGLLVAIGTLAWYLWQVSGYAGLVGLAVALLIAAAGIVWRLRREIVRGPAPFSATVAEFQKDLEWVRPNR